MRVLVTLTKTDRLRKKKMKGTFRNKYSIRITSMWNFLWVSYFLKRELSQIHSAQTIFNICSVCKPLTSSMLISKGPWDWHSGQEPGFTSWFWDWKKGPSTKLHLLQLYLTIPSWGRTPVQLLTTPLVRINWFRWSCLRKRYKTIYQQKDWQPSYPIRLPIHSIKYPAVSRHLNIFSSLFSFFSQLYFTVRIDRIGRL